jgi:TIR domain
MRYMTYRSPAWDVFISHASEDKESFVRPLAMELSRLGLRAWYDEFSLGIGDSISASIDKGLAESEFGIVVISTSFISKPWPQRELAGLVARQMGQGKVILPIWYNIASEDVLAFSPPLADRKAVIASQQSISDIALQIIERVKPELHQAYMRRLAFERQIRDPEVELGDIAYKDILLDGPIRHETLRNEIILALRVIREALLEVFDVDWRTTVDTFRKEIRPDVELLTWLNITGIYLVVVHEYDLARTERGTLLTRITHWSGSPELWELGDNSPDWERRAHELLTFKGDPTAEAFASTKFRTDRTS